jgi:hypothetical protein
MKIVFQYYGHEREGLRYYSKLGGEQPVSKNTDEFIFINYN